MCMLRAHLPCATHPDLEIHTALSTGLMCVWRAFFAHLPFTATCTSSRALSAGLMCVWRAFFAIYLDLWSFRGVGAARRDRSKDMEHFADSLKGAMLMSLAFCVVLQVGGWVSWLVCLVCAALHARGQGEEVACQKRAALLVCSMHYAAGPSSRQCTLPPLPLPFTLQCLGGVVGEEQLELLVSSLLTGQHTASAAARPL